MRYIQYARKSSEGDERQVQSIPDQNSVLDRLSAYLNLDVVSKLEEAHSAKQPGSRPVFAQMLDHIKAGKADAILCWHLNRLTRNPVDSGTLSWLLQQGVIKCIKTPDREYRPDDNVVIMAVENAVSNQYIVDLRHNVRRAQLEKAARGWYPHKPPGGYLTNRETGEIEVDPERFAMLREAWDLMLRGSHSAAEVHRKLRALGYRTRLGKNRQGKMLTRSNLYKLFDNPFYYGEFSFLGQRYVGKHRPMVTREEFGKVQKILHGVDPTASKRHFFAFTGLIRCGGCGCMVTAERKVKHYRGTNRVVTYTYYRCTRSKGCKEPSVTESYVRGEIAKKLDRCHLNPIAVEWARAALEEGSNAPNLSSKEQLTKHRDELVLARSKLENLFELRLTGEISAEELKGLRAKYQDEVFNIEEAIERLEKRAERNQRTRENLLGFVSDARAAFQAGDEKVKREVASALAESYLLTLGTLKIQPHPLLEPLLALEPPKTPANMGKRSPVGPKNPFLCAWRDFIRTLLTEKDVSFPKLDCLNQEHT